MEIGEKVTVQILGSDILTSEYGSISDCALAKATKRHFNTKDVCAGGRTISVGNVMGRDFEINTDQFNGKVFRDLKEKTTYEHAEEVVVEVELTYYRDLDF